MFTDFLVKLFIKDSENVENPKVRKSYAMLSNIIGIAVNIILFITKLVVGMLSGAVSVVADAFNNISDAGSNIVSIIGFRMSSKHEDKKHPHGHGRLEYITAFIVDIMIIFVGAELFFETIKKIQSPKSINISILSLVLLLLSIVIKFGMYLFYRKIAKKINSSAIRATSLDSLSDVAATSLVLISALFSKFFYIELDGWAGILVASFIIFTGLRAAKETVELLLGASPKPEFVEEIKEFVKNYPEVIGTHDLMVHDYGPSRLIITLHAEVSADSNLVRAHEIIDIMERDMQRKFNSVVTIHLDPVIVGNERADMMQKLSEDSAKEIDKDFTIHDFRMIDGEEGVVLVFDLCIPADSKYKDEEAAELVDECIKQKIPGCCTIINAEHPFV